MAKYYMVLASWTKTGAQQEQSTLQKKLKHGIPQISKNSCLKMISGVSDKYNFV